MIVGWEAASFRDRTARVYHDEGRIFRALSTRGWSNWRSFSKSRLASELMTEGLLIGTREVEAGPSGLDGCPVLEHERVPVVSYSYEWPFSLLKLAALRHLELLRRLIPEGFILSDATPSNVMFRGIHPVFVDVSSIVPYEPGDVWQGFKQFLETMLYPLLLSAYKGLPHQAWLRGTSGEGLPAWQVSGLFGWADLRRRGVLSHVKLAAWLERVAEARLDLQRRDFRASGVPARVLLRNVGRLERLVAHLQPGPRPGAWNEYQGAAIYGEEGQQRKRAAVQSLVAQIRPRPRTVWDLGCNTGEYSVLLSPGSEAIVAMDEAEAVVEALYPRCRAERVDNVLPLVVDVGNPSPAQGWRGAERKSLGARGEADLVLALAVMHHLVLARNLPADQLLAELAGWGRYCLIEHVAPADPMAERLRRNAGEGRNELPDPRVFEALASEPFHVRDRRPVTETRMLYLLERRTPG